MSIEPRELLIKMKEYEFVYDTKVGQLVNKSHEEDKEYILKILDLLYENYERVIYTDDFSYLEKKSWAVLISQKFAMQDKRLPLPQFPFSIQYDGKPNIVWRSKLAYYILIGFFQETDEKIYVSLNFRDERYRKVYKTLMEKNR